MKAQIVKLGGVQLAVGRVVHPLDSDVQGLRSVEMDLGEGTINTCNYTH